MSMLRMSSGDAIAVFLGRKISDISEENYQLFKNIYCEMEEKLDQWAGNLPNLNRINN